MHVPSTEVAPVFDATGLSAIIDCMPSGACVIDEGGLICLVNAALERTFGVARSELLGRSVDQLLPERHRAAHGGHRQAYFDSPSARSMGGRGPLFGLRTDGTEFPIEVGLTPLELPSGRFVVASVVDLSRHRTVEESLMAVIHSTPTPTLIMNERGEMVSVNSPAADMFGYSAGELHGKRVEDLIPERYRAQHPTRRSDYLAAPTMRAMGEGRDLTGLHRDGREVPVEIGLNPIQLGGQRMVIASVVDLTGRKKLELELRQANQNLEEFTYVASHDLKSPLRGIANLVEWMAEDLAEGDLDKVRKNLERVHLRVERMESIIDDLLAYARAGRRSRELVQVEPLKLLEGICEILPRPAGLEIHFSVDAAPFKAPRIPLETALRNLVSNAIKHHDKERGSITLTVLQNDNYCVFEVRDDGPGIPDAAVERIFRLFQTLSASEREGSGIGLALTKRLVEAHGGSVRVTNNTPQPGATFTLCWPRFQRRDLDDNE